MSDRLAVAWDRVQLCSKELGSMKEMRAGILAGILNTIRERNPHLQRVARSNYFVAVPEPSDVEVLQHANAEEDIELSAFDAMIEATQAELQRLSGDYVRTKWLLHSLKVEIKDIR